MNLNISYRLILMICNSHFNWLGEKRSAAAQPLIWPPRRAFGVGDAFPGDPLDWEYALSG